MALITYADKQAMGTQPSIPEINKVTDSNMNEIKSVVNANANYLEDCTTYSTTETVVGTWIDGKPIYRIVKSAKTGGTGGTSFNYTTTPSNIDTMIKVDGILTAMSARFPINAYYDSSYYISAYYDPAGYIKGICGASLTNRNCVVILEYTKTTD